MIAAVPVFTWTGFYVGVNAGYGWNANDSITGRRSRRVDRDDDGGFVGGAQAGYNYQIGSFVVGLEGDIQYADFGGDDRFDFDGDGIFDDDSDKRLVRHGPRSRRCGLRSRSDLRHRRLRLSLTTRTGWTVGGGLEYAFTNNLTGQDRRSVRQPRPGRQLPGPRPRQRRRVRCGARWPELQASAPTKIRLTRDRRKGPGHPGPFCFYEPKQMLLTGRAPECLAENRKTRVHRPRVDKTCRVMAGLMPTFPRGKAPRLSYRDHRHTAGDDDECEFSSRHRGAEAVTGRMDFARPVMTCGTPDRELRRTRRPGRPGFSRAR